MKWKGIGWQVNKDCLYYHWSDGSAKNFIYFIYNINKQYAEENTINLKK